MLVTLLVAMVHATTCRSGACLIFSLQRCLCFTCTLITLKQRAPLLGSCKPSSSHAASQRRGTQFLFVNIIKCRAALNVQLEALAYRRRLAS